MERRAAPRQLIEHRLVDLGAHPLEERAVHLRDRRERPHAAGVGAGVAVADPLEVARGGERERRLAVAQRQHGQLVAVEERLDEHGMLAEAPLDQHRLQRRPRLLLVGGDHHALAGGQAVRLDDRRVAVDGRHAVFDGLDHRVGGGRDARGDHDLLRERLRTLQLRGGGARPEAGEAPRGAGVGQARHQRRLGAGHDQVHARLDRRGGQTLDVAGIRALQHRRVARDAGVPGRAQQLGRLRRARQRAHDRVLAPARTHHEHPQGVSRLLCLTSTNGVRPLTATR